MGWRRNAGGRLGIALGMCVFQATNTEISKKRCFGTSQGTVDRTNITIQVVERSWPSARLATEVTRIVLQEFLNYNVIVVDGKEAPTENWGVDMTAGNFDLEMESWKAGSSTDRYLEYVINKQKVIAGSIGYGGRYGLFTTCQVSQVQHFASYYMFYKSSIQLKDSGYAMFGKTDIRAAVGDEFPVCSHSSIPYCGEAGTIYENHYVPPLCQAHPTECAVAIMESPIANKGYFEQLTTNHGLKLIHTWAGSKHVSMIKNLVEEGKETVFYWWLPDPFPSIVKAVRISFPAHSFGCDSGNTEEPGGPIHCDYPELLLSKLVKAALRSQAPEAFFVWRSIEFHPSHMEWMMAQTTDAAGILDISEAACKWVKEHREIVERWAPACVSSPTQDGDSFFDTFSLTCKTAARFLEGELMETCFDVRPSSIDRSSKKIRVAERDWLSHQLTSYLTALILKEFLGYKVIITDATSTPPHQWGQDMDAGSFDLDVESWQADSVGTEYQTYVREKGVVLNPGPIGYKGRSGLAMFPAAFEENVFTSFWRLYQDKALINETSFIRYPGPPQVPSMKVFLEDDFPKCTASWCPNSTSLLHGYWIPPQCERKPERCLLVIHAQSNYDTAYFEQLTRNLNLYFIFAYYGPKFGNVVLNGFRKGSFNMLFYMWEPSVLPAQIKPVRLTFPDHTYACDAGNTRDAYTGSVACDYRERQLQKLVRTEVKTLMPQAYTFLKSLHVQKSDIDWMLTMHTDAGGPLNSSFKIACTWAQKNEGKIRSTFAPACISAPKEVSQVKLGDHVFDPKLHVCREVSCQMDEVLETTGSVSCRRCGPGQVPNRNRTDCEACTPGDVPSRTEGICVACPFGHFCPFGSELAEECDRGSYADQTTMLECARCKKGRFQALRGQSACDECPLPMTTMVPGARSAHDCMCPEQMYKPLNATNPEGYPWHESTTACRPCPRGMSCEEGSEEAAFFQSSRLKHPTVDPGFWSSSANPLSIYECKPREHCPGGSPESCSGKRVGLICGSCPENMRTTRSDCSECQTSDKLYVAVFLVAIVLVLPLALYFVCSTHHRWRVTPQVAIPICCDIQVEMLQVAACVALLDITWPSPVDDIISFMSTFQFEINGIVPTSCLWTMKEDSIQFAMSCLLIPSMVLGVLAWYFICLYAHVLPRLRATGWDLPGTLNVCGKIFNTLFISQVMVSMAPMFCYAHPTGETSMRDFPSTFCEGSRYNIMISVGIASLFICIAYFSYVPWELYRLPKRMTDRDYKTYMKRVVFIVEDYRKDMYFWNIIAKVQEIILSMVFVIDPNNARIQLALFLMIFLASLFLWTNCQPYKLPLLNLMASFLLGVLIIILVAGTFFIPAATTDEEAFAEYLVVIPLILAVIFVSGTLILVVTNQILRGANGELFCLVQMQRVPSTEVLLQSWSTTAMLKESEMAVLIREWEHSELRNLRRLLLQTLPSYKDFSIITRLSDQLGGGTANLIEQLQFRHRTKVYQDPEAVSMSSIGPSVFDNACHSRHSGEKQGFENCGHLYVPKQSALGEHGSHSGEKQGFEKCGHLYRPTQSAFGEDDAENGQGQHDGRAVKEDQDAWCELDSHCDQLQCQLPGTNHPHLIGAGEELDADNVRLERGHVGVPRDETAVSKLSLKQYESEQSSIGIPEASDDCRRAHYKSIAHLSSFDE